MPWPLKREAKNFFSFVFSSPLNFSFLSAFFFPYFLKLIENEIKIVFTTREEAFIEGVMT